MEYPVKELFSLPLVISHLSFSYGEKEILKDISVTFPEKGFVVLLGKSGSGKSTLLGLLSHTLPLTKGTISGNERESISFVFQNPLLLDYLDVRTNVLLFAKMNGKDVLKEDVDSVLSRLGILSLAERRVSSLSGGEKMRVSLARALLLNRPILILDEPTGQLDAGTTEDINHLLKELSRDHLLLMVTHDEKSAVLFADELYLLKEGKLICRRKSEVIYKTEKHQREKGKAMKWKEALLLTLSYLKSKRVRMVLSSLFLFLNLFFLYFGIEVYRNSGEFLMGLREEYYDSDTVKLQEMVTIAKEGHLSLKQYQIPKEEKAKAYGFSELYPSLSFFIPDSKEITLNGVEGTILLAPVLSQKKERRLMGEAAGKEEIVVNESFLSQFLISPYEAIGKTIAFSHTFLLYGNEMESREVLALPYTFTIVGISREKKLMNNPRAYYDYGLMIDYFSEIKLENLSMEWNRDVYLSELLDIRSYSSENFLSFSAYSLAENPIASMEQCKEDTFCVTNSSLTFYSSLLEVMTSLSKIVLLFLSLDLILAFLCSFLLMYSLFEGNLRYFALLTLSDEGKRNKRRTVLTYSSLFSACNGILLFLSILLFSFLLDGLLSYFTYPRFFHGISFLTYFALLLLLLLISFLSSFLGLRKVKEEEVKGQLEGEE